MKWKIYFIFIWAFCTKNLTKFANKVKFNFSSFILKNVFFQAHNTIK